MAKTTKVPDPEMLERIRGAEGSLTQVTALGGGSGRVHVGVDEGTYDSVPLCPALANRNTETTSDLANCPACKALLRAAGADLAGLFDVPDDYNPRSDRYSADYDPPDERW